MEIIVGRSTAARAGPGLPGRQEEARLGPRHDRMLGALVTAGMSEEAALEQIARLTAGDIWCG